MTTLSCPACSHDFDVKVVVGVARSRANTTVLAHATGHVEAYLAARTLAAPTASLMAAALYADYLAWRGPGADLLSTKAFGMGMRANGVAWVRTSRGTRYTSVRLQG